MVGMMPEPIQHPSLEDFELLAEVSQMLTVLDQDRVLERVIDLMANAVGASRSQPDLASRVRRRLAAAFRQVLPAVAPGNGSERPIRFTSRAGCSTKGWRAGSSATSRGRWSYDTRQDERWYMFPDSTSKARSALCVPLLYNGEVLAVLTMLYPDAGSLHRVSPAPDDDRRQSGDRRGAQRPVVQPNAAAAAAVETVLHTIPDYLLVLDEQGKIVLVNDTAASCSQANKPAA